MKKYLSPVYILLFFLIVKCWMLIDYPIFAIGGATVDDRLYLNYAASIESLKWLGDYNSNTLAKGAFYSMWLVLNNITGLQYMLSVFLFYGISIIFLYKSLERLWSDNRLLLVGFIIIIYNPYIEHVNRIIREGIYPALIIFFISYLIKIVADNRNGKFSVVTHIAAGLFLGFFWNTREEGVWLIPSILLWAGVVFYDKFKGDGSLSNALNIFKRLSIIPLVAMSITYSIATINYLEYGTFTTIDFKSAPYKSAYASLNRVKNIAIKSRHVPVNKETRQLIYEISPSFAELRDLLENPEYPYRGASCDYYKDACGDYAGGWFMWAFRLAVEQRGYYSTAKNSESYYKKIAREIDSACDSQLLDCYAKKRSLAPTLNGEDYLLIVKAMKKGIYTLFIGFRNAPIVSNSLGDDASINLFKKLLNSSERQISTNYKITHPIQLYKLNILTYIKGIYDFILLPIFVSLGILSLFVILLFYKRIVRKKYLLMIYCLIVLAILARLGLLAIIDVTSFPGISFVYLVPLYSMVLILGVVSLQIIHELYSSFYGPAQWLKFNFSILAVVILAIPFGMKGYYNQNNLTSAQNNSDKPIREIVVETSQLDDLSEVRFPVSDSSTFYQIDLVNDEYLSNLNQPIVIEQKFIKITGWAADDILKDRSQGLFVELSGKFFKVKRFGLERPDVAKLNANYLKSGFESFISVDSLPSGLNELNIWVINSINSATYKPDPSKKLVLEIRK